MPSNKFKDDYYVDSYRLAKEGMRNNEIAGALGTTLTTFKKWIIKYPALKKALKEARIGNNPQKVFSFQDYVYNQLPEELKTLWDEIHAIDELENGVELIEEVLKGTPTRTRQYLFIHAMVSSMFNVSRSLAKLNITKRIYYHWCDSDPDFAELVRELIWHKDNFFEQALMGRVAAGDTSAILHVAKTKLGYRGYSDKIEVHHTGQVEHKHTVELTELDLPIEVRKVILEALRVHQGETKLIDNPIEARAIGIEV